MEQEMHWVTVMLSVRYEMLIYALSPSALADQTPRYASFLLSYIVLMEPGVIYASPSGRCMSAAVKWMETRFRSLRV